MIVQGDSFNYSQLATVVVIPLTTTIRLAAMPGNVLLSASKTGLPKDSVANVTQMIALDRSLLTGVKRSWQAGNLVPGPSSWLSPLIRLSAEPSSWAMVS